MQEIKKLGIRGIGPIDKQYGTETAAHITAVCQGKRKTHSGFAWSYK